MWTTDYEKYKFCLNYARTMLFMAQIIKDEYGANSLYYIQYINIGKKCVEIATKYKNRWCKDKTIKIKIAA